jgi:hypothetical protein
VSFWFDTDTGEPKGPVVDIWTPEPADNGQAVFVFGETADGQRFFGSFFEPTLQPEDNPQ